MEKQFKIILFIIIGILIIQRFFHFGDFIENPHSWRQFDTYFYAYDFYYNGINIFKPSVSWMGGYKTLILEFPIISVLMSFAFYLPGSEVFYMRIISFLFFFASAVYLFKIVKLLFHERLAYFVFVVYLMLPLGVYYSIALQIDFAVVFFMIAMLYYYTLGYNNNNVKLIWLGTFFGILAYLIKIPYVMIIYFPLLYFVIKNKHFKYFLKTVPIIIFPFIIFILWQFYTIKTNSNAPDWYFIPGYFKFNNMSEWYFGNISDRLIFANWKVLFDRFFENIAMYLGIVLFIMGLLTRNKTVNKAYFNYYALGSIIYLIIFFKLNLIHDYYQIPLLVMSAFFIGFTLNALYEKFVLNLSGRSFLYLSIIIIVLSVNGIWFTERWFYKPDELRNKISEMIRNNSDINDLIISSIEDTDPRDPRILAGAQRYGWSIRTNDLSPQLIDSLKSYGANSLIIVLNIDNRDMIKYIPSNLIYKREQLSDDKEILFYSLGKVFVE